MASSRLILLLAIAALCFGCASTRPFARFQKATPLIDAPSEFKLLQASRGQVNATISMRAPGLRGSASGVVRHAKADQYLVELYGRGELFMKVYFTGEQTVVWPLIGSPQIFARSSTPTLRSAVHRMLPDWRLDDVLPIPYSIANSSATSEWAAYGGKSFQQRIERDDHDVLYKTYKGRRPDSTFPFHTVTLQTESGNCRMKWRLKPDNQPTQ